MFTMLNVAHKWSKNPPILKMLTTLENAHNAWKCSQCLKMFTTLENVHNDRKCSQRLKMLTSLKMLTRLENAHNAYTGSVTLHGVCQWQAKNACMCLFIQCVVSSWQMVDYATAGKYILFVDYIFVAPCTVYLTIGFGMDLWIPFYG